MGRARGLLKRVELIVLCAGVAVTHVVASFDRLIVLIKATIKRHKD